MKLKIILSLLLLMFSVSPSFASFPVQRTVNKASVSIDNEIPEDLYSPAAAGGQKSKGVAIVLLLVLGFVAAHRWYLGSPWIFNVMFILTLGGFGIWALIDLIRIITGDYGPVNGRYKKSFF